MTKISLKSHSGLAVTALAMTLLALPVSFTVAGVTFKTGPDTAYARGGADDGADHDKGDDHGRGRGHGADDGANHDKGDDRGRGRGRGADDGANHTSLGTSNFIILARRGADDGANHDKGDDRGRGRGRGTDDGPNHA